MPWGSLRRLNRRYGFPALSLARHTRLPSTLSQPKKNEEELKRVALVVGVGVAVRLLLLVIVDPTNQAFAGDTIYYVNGQADGVRAPLYGMFLGATLPAGLWAPLTLQCALTILSGLAAYLVLDSLWIGLAIAACPFLAIFDLKLASESLYINLLWLGWLALAKQRGIAGGILVGLSLLTRDTLLLLPLFALLFTRTKRVAVLAIVAYAVVLPWQLTGASSQRLGLNLWLGTWERNGDWYRDGLDHPYFPRYAFASDQERAAVMHHWIDDRLLFRIAIKRIEQHPWRTVGAWTLRYPNLWLGTRTDLVVFRSYRKSTWWTVEKAGFYFFNLMILFFGLWGLSKPDWLFVPPIFYLALLYVPFHAENRYTLAALPFLMWQGVRKAQGFPGAPVSEAVQLHGLTAPRFNLSRTNDKLRLLVM
jgi:hypothetical protein